MQEVWAKLRHLPKNRISAPLKSHKTTTDRPERYVPGGLSLVMKVYFSSPSGKMILLTKKKITMEMPPLRMVVPML